MNIKYQINTHLTPMAVRLLGVATLELGWEALAPPQF